MKLDLDLKEAGLNQVLDLISDIIHARKIKVQGVVEPHSRASFHFTKRKASCLLRCPCDKILKGGWFCPNV
jgi:hypothetical protein